MESNLQIEVGAEIKAKLFGVLDRNVAAMEKIYTVKIGSIDIGVRVVGEEGAASQCCELIGILCSLISCGHKVDRLLVDRCAEMIADGEGADILDMYTQAVAVTARGKRIVCKTTGQKRYFRAMQRNAIVFGVGPAGTGKTYLAVACAVNAFKKNEVDKIILTRPAIEAGEKLGFLPGDLQMKVDPYLRPLYDALEEMFGVDNYTALIERGIIEIAPLAFMRGRTLSRSFIILDEAQNTTNEQMKMFLTRMGEGSKLVVTGDLTQIDLPRAGESGLKQAIGILDDIEDIAVCRLSDKDVVRHELVQRIVRAYEKLGENK